MAPKLRSQNKKHLDVEPNMKNDLQPTQSRKRKRKESEDEISEVGRKENTVLLDKQLRVLGKNGTKVDQSLSSQ